MERNIDIYASKLGDEKLGMLARSIMMRIVVHFCANHSVISIDVKLRANVATELRDTIEPLCSGASYPIFLSKLWPVFKTILKGDPVFFSMSYDQVRFFGTSLASVNVAHNGLTTLAIH